MSKSSYSRLKECESDPTIDFLNLLSKGYSPFSYHFQLADDLKAFRIFGDWLIVALKTGKVLVYNLSTKIEFSQFSTECPLNFLAFDPEKSLIIVPGTKSYIQFWTIDGKIDSKNNTLHKSELKKGLFFNCSLYLADAKGCISVNGPKNVAIVQGHKKKVNCIEALCNLATCSDDKYVKVWSLNLTLICSFKMKKPAKFVSFVSADKLVSGGRNSEFFVWDLNQKTVVHKFENSGDGILCCVPDANMGFLLCGTQVGHVDIYSSGTNTHEESFSAHPGEIKCIGLNKSGSLLITAGKEKSLKIWQIYKELPSDKYLSDHLDDITSMAINESSGELHSGDASGCYIIWDLSLEKQIFEIKAHSSTISGILISSPYTLTISYDQSLKQWENDTLIKSINMNEVLLSICSANDMIFIGCRNGSIHTFNTLLIKQRILAGHWNSVTTLVSFNKFLLSGSHDQTIQIWDLSTLSSLYKFKAHDSSIKRIKVHPNFLSFFSFACDRSFKYWYSGIPPYEINLPMTPACILSLTFVQNGLYLYTGDKNGKVCIYCSAELVKVVEFDLGESIHEILEYKNRKSVIFAAGKKIVIKKDLMAESGVLTFPNNQSFLYLQYLSSLVRGKNLAFKQMYKDIIVMPMKINILHVLVYINDYENLKVALESSTKFLKSCGKTPLKLALDRGSYQCVDIILKFIPTMRNNTNPKIFCTIEDEICEILALQLKNLPSLLSLAFPIVKNKELPNLANLRDLIILDSDRPGINSNDFNLTGSQNSIEFRVSLFRIPLELGSERCSVMLNGIFNCENIEIFDQKLIQSILIYLYDQSFFVLLVINALNLVSIVVLMLFKFYTENYVFSCFVLITNGVNFGFEISQIVQDFWYYVKDIWNFIDIIRIFCSSFAVILWATDAEKWVFQEVLSLALLFSMFRLISIFRLFSGTRYMIRMVFQVILDISSFLFLLFFTTFTLAFSFYVLRPGDGIYSMFNQMYLMNFGEFEYERIAGDDWYSSALFYVALFINPLVMMNLLIATMESTYSKIQENLLISNYKEIASLAIEASSYLVWKRNMNNKKFLQTCGVREHVGVSNTLANKLKKMKILTDTIKGVQNNTLQKIDEIIQKVQVKAK